MGPELGCKSAGRCSYHKRGRCTGAAVGDYFVHQLFYAFSGFMDRKQLERYGCSGSTFTDTNQIAFAITMGAIISVGLAFATSIGFQFFYTAILRILEQSVAITTALFLFHMYSRSHSHSGSHAYRGDKIRSRQPPCAPRKRVTRPYLASLTAAGQSSTSFKPVFPMADQIRSGRLLQPV